MADEDDDKIIETAKIREVKKELEELESAIASARKTAEEREKERIVNYESFLKLIQTTNSEEITAAEQRVESLREEASLKSELEKKLLLEKADSLEKALNIAKSANDQDKQSYTNLINKKIEENDRFFNALSRIRDGLNSAFADIDGAALKAMGSALGLAGIFGVQVPKIKDLFQDFAVSLDDARRSIVPFTTSIEDANNLQTKFKDISTATKIPITELGDTVGSAAGQFRMFALMTQGAQANLVGFHAQMKSMGVETGSSMIESLMSDSGVQSSDDAIGIFKALTVQMKELGVMPETLAADYNKLIGTFAMFGDAASINIGRTSLAAAKARIDVGAITGFGDNFSGYSQAASTAQQINAIFGRRVIDNPAELVSIFYTGGGEAALEYVKRKLVTSGVDLEEMLGGAAGAARLQMLGGMGFGGAQQARRALLGDTTITPGEQASIEEAAAGGPAGGGAQATFDSLAKEMLNQADRIKQLNESVTVKFFEGLGTGLGEFGNMFDNMLENLTVGFDKLTEKFIKGAKTIQIPGAGGVDPLTGELKSGTLRGTVQNLTDIGAQQSSLNTSMEKSTIAQDKNTEQMRLLGESVVALANQIGTSPAGGETASAVGAGGGTRVTLQIGRREFDAYLHNAIDGFSKGRA